MAIEMSTSIGTLAGALAKAQGEMAAAKKDSDNPFFKHKYADLSECWESCRGPLSKNGLAVIQTPEIKEGDNGGVVLTTTLAHSSGEWIRSAIFMPLAKRDAQGVGSAITYARRYGLSAIVGIVSDDDDGEAAVGRTRTDGHSGAPSGKPPQRPAAAVTSGKGASAEAAAQNETASSALTEHQKLQHTLFNMLTNEEGLGFKQTEIGPFVTRVIGRKVQAMKDVSEAELARCIEVAREELSSRRVA